MRILVVTDKYPPAATGGYELSCADVVERWRRDGHTVTVLSTPADVAPEPGVFRTLTWATEPHAAARSAAAADDALLVARPDVVSAWNLGGLPPAVLSRFAASGVPVVFVVCDGWLHEARATGWRAAASAPGSRTAFVSDHLRRATRLPSWAPPTTVVPSGIDESVFGAAHQRVAVRPWTGRLLFAGRPVPAKGVDDAIAALATLPDSTCLRIVGRASPARRAQLIDLVAACGVSDRVELDVTDRHGLVREYQLADAVLFPSRWAEPFGLVPLEAMACGTPVIATGTGGSASYLVDRRNALLVPPRDPRALGRAVRRLADDPQLRHRLVGGGAQTWPSYTVELLADRLGELNRRAASASEYTSSTSSASVSQS